MELGGNKQLRDREENKETNTLIKCRVTCSVFFFFCFNSDWNHKRK